MALPVLPEDSVRVADRFHRIRRLVGFLVVLGLLMVTFAKPGLRSRGYGEAASWGGAWIAGTVFHLAACVLFVRLKGRNPWLGLIGVLGIFGVLVLYLMQSECHRCGRREKTAVRACPSCGAPM